MPSIDNENFEFNTEYGNFEYGESEWSGESEVFGEAELLELAGELLSVSSEAELDQFLGKLVKKASGAVGGFIKSPMGQAVGGVLKGVAKKALPLAGGAIGAYFGGPLGAKIGSGLASAAGSALGLEAEAFEGEEREFEGAKTFIRLAGDTVRSAAAAPGGAHPAAIAQQAISAAVARHAPQLMNRSANGAPARTLGPRGSRGHWVRKGKTIVLFNL